MAQPNQEPSMEDILASIKRIIAEDGEPPRQPRNALRRGPVAVPDPGAEPPAGADARDDDPADILELTSPLIDPEPEPMPQAEPAAGFPPPPAAEPARDTGPVGEAQPEPVVSGTILSGAAALASRTAFAALGQLHVRADDGKAGTLEGLVADLLRPMLRDWLDRELPSLVERLVQEEIRRVSGRG